MVTQSSLGHTFYLIWPCSNWGRQKVGVRKIHTHTQRIVRACVWLVSGQWLVSYTPLLTGQSCLFVWPPDNLGPHIFSLLYLKKQICCSAPSCSPSIYLSSFLSCELKCSEHGSAFHHLGAWKNMMKSFLKKHSQSYGYLAFSTQSWEKIGLSGAKRSYKNTGTSDYFSESISP